MATRTQAISAAVQAAISSRNLCGNEADAIADAGADHGIAFTPNERVEIAIKIAALWREAQDAAGVTRYAQANDYRALGKG